MGKLVLCLYLYVDLCAVQVTDDNNDIDCKLIHVFISLFIAFLSLSLLIIKYKI